MIKIIFFGLFCYFGFKIFTALVKFSKFKQKIRKKNDQVTFHKKLSKMDIQDAEFEER